MTLRRLILTIKPDGHELRVLYKRQDDPGPSTKARRREGEQLARGGLTAALEALDAGDVEMIGTAGFDTREDVLSLEPLQREGTPTAGEDISGLRTASSDTQKPMRKGA